jgi:hypothetical protein
LSEIETRSHPKPLGIPERYNHVIIDSEHPVARGIQKRFRALVPGVSNESVPEL